MEVEGEDQENEVEDERDGEECRVESRGVSRQRQHHADDTCDDVRDTLNLNQCQGVTLKECCETPRKCDV